MAEERKTGEVKDDCAGSSNVIVHLFYLWEAKLRISIIFFTQFML